MTGVDKIMKGVGDLEPEGRDFISIGFHNEEPCECSSCGKQISSGVRIYITRILGKDLPKPFGNRNENHKGSIVFCNECWIPPDLEALLSIGDQLEPEKL
jgi:hypothetical protein